MGLLFAVVYRILPSCIANLQECRFGFGGASGAAIRLAREGGVSGDINAECQGLFASKLCFYTDS
jgi:hypothetical protein